MIIVRRNIGKTARDIYIDNLDDFERLRHVFVCLYFNSFELEHNMLQ